MSQPVIDFLYLVKFGCTRTPPMDQRTIACRTKARASQYYGVYPSAVMR